MGQKNTFMLLQNYVMSELENSWYFFYFTKVLFYIFLFQYLIIYIWHEVFERISHAIKILILFTYVIYQYPWFVFVLFLIFL